VTGTEHHRNHHLNKILYLKVYILGFVRC